MTGLFHARAFGLNWQSDAPLGAFDPVSDAVPDVIVARTDAIPDRSAPVRRLDRGAIFADGFRFHWRDEVDFDLFDGTHIVYRTGPGWTGGLPAAFFSTVAALTLAWRDHLPLHATAVEVDGRAVLIAGRAGAGKSTLAAELVGAGARLLSDDLSVLAPLHRDAPIMVHRGRPSMRLHPETAHSLEAFRREKVAPDPRGKLLVWPARRSEADALPLAGLILLGGSPGPIAPQALTELLPRLTFRPRWLAALPGYWNRGVAMLGLAARIPAVGLPPVSGFGAAEQAVRLKAAREAIAALTAGVARL